MRVFRQRTRRARTAISKQDPSAEQGTNGCRAFPRSQHRGGLLQATNAVRMPLCGGGIPPWITESRSSRGCRRVCRVRAHRGRKLRIHHAVREVAADGGARARQVPEVRCGYPDAPETDAAATIAKKMRPLLHGRRGSFAGWGLPERFVKPDCVDQGDFPCRWRYGCPLNKAARAEARAGRDRLPAQCGPQRFRQWMLCLAHRFL